MFRKIFGKQYRHLNKILISRSALEQNYLQLQSLHPHAFVAPVLKSNAYGHGLKTVAPAFDNLHPEFLVVDSLYEAYELQKLKVRSKILILGYTHPENYSVKQLHFHITIFDLETAKSLNKHQRNCKVHIFVDTGMSREGVTLDELEAFVSEIKKLKNLELVGLASHFADADNPKDDSFTQKQLLGFLKALHILQDFGITPKYRHISASGGALKVNHREINMIRAGLVSYGINPLDSKDESFSKISLRPALELVSTIAHIKNIKKGVRVGYSGTYEAKKDMRIAVLPLGYYEGVDRRLSNCGYVSVSGAMCPIIGRVSMNMTTVDISEVKKVSVGDRVIVYSNKTQDSNSITQAAQFAETIPYELLVHLAESIRREVV